MRRLIQVERNVGVLTMDSIQTAKVDPVGFTRPKVKQDASVSVKNYSKNHSYVVLVSNCNKNLLCYNINTLLFLNIVILYYYIIIL